MRAVVESELGSTARRVVRLAERAGWAVVGVASTGDEGEEVVTLRGRRSGQRFVVMFVEGSYEAAWWWTRQHSTVVKGYRSVQREVRVNSYTVRLEVKLEHDPGLDETVTWTSTEPSWEKLGPLSDLVGVASRNIAGLLDSELDVS